MQLGVYTKSSSQPVICTDRLSAHRFLDLWYLCNALRLLSHVARLPCCQLQGLISVAASHEGGVWVVTS